MKKAVKGRKWANGKSPVKGVLNEALDNREADFMERQTKDIVHIQLIIHENQYGFYSEEYLPDTVSQDGHKRADISVIIVDENASKCLCYLADVKSQIGGEDEIYHLCSQWNDGLKYLEHTVFCYLDDETDIDRHIMVITRKFDSARIADSIQSRKRRLEELDRNARMLLTAQKVRSQEAPRLRMEIRMLELFFRQQFLYKTRETEQTYSFEVLLLEREAAANLYQCQLRAEIS